MESHGKICITVSGDLQGAFRANFGGSEHEGFFFSGQDRSHFITIGKRIPSETVQDDNGIGHNESRARLKTRAESVTGKSCVRT